MRDLINFERFRLPDGATFDWFVARPLAILSLIVAGVVIRWLTHRLINRITKKAATGAMPGMLGNGKAGAILRDIRPGSAERREQRASAMGSLLKSIATGLIGAIVLLMVIDQIGYNIAPLIASAGIFGLAFGFGAQSLVKDFIAGVFMIIEDQYGVGDWVDLGEAIGTVEAVSLRVTRLRDLNGTVWYVRNGEILRVGNSSQNWSRTVLDIPVLYDSDLTVVQNLIRDAAHDLWEDESFKHLVIEEPEVWGIERWETDAIVIRVVMKTAPSQQSAVARELRKRVMARFATEGIEMPHTPRGSARFRSQETMEE